MRAWVSSDIQPARTTSSVWTPASIAARTGRCSCSFVILQRRCVSALERRWAGLRSYRAVMRTENIEIAYINLVLYGVGFVGLATLPLFHVNAQSWSMFSVLGVGATAVSA